MPRERAFGSIWPTRWNAILPGPVSGTFAIALGLFVVTAIALSVNLARQTESIGWIQHTDAVLRNIFAIETRILEAESAERGYLLTGAQLSRQLYPVHVITRKSLGLMMRKLSVTESHIVAQLRGTFSRSFNNNASALSLIHI